MKFYQQTHKGVKIIAPQKRMITKYQRRLDLIPKMDKGLKTILITPTKGDGGALYREEKAYVVEGGTVLRNELVWEASCLVHEMRHAWQHSNWKRYNWDRGEKDASVQQTIFLCWHKRKDLADNLERQLTKKWWRKGKKINVIGVDVLGEWFNKYENDEARITKVV